MCNPRLGLFKARKKRARYQRSSLLCRVVIDVGDDGQTLHIVVGTSTHSQGKNPTSNPLFPRHQMDSSGGGMSITDIMSPTWKE